MRAAQDIEDAPAEDPPADRGKSGKSGATVLAGWGRQPVMRGSEVHPSGLGEVPACLVPPYLPRGMGRSYGDAGLPAAGHRAVNSSGLDRFLSFDAGTGILEAESGVSLDRILRFFVPRGWFLPVTPGTTLVSLGGALASNVHGKNHHRTGSIEKFVEDLEVATPAGTFACSPRNNPDLFHATVGGYGLTGFITRVRLRLKPIRSSRVDCRRIRAKGLDDLFRLFGLHDAGWEYSVAWLDSLSRGRSLGRGILMLGNHEEPKHPGGIQGGESPGGGTPGSMTREAGTRSAAEAAYHSLLRIPVRTRVKVPFPMPGFLLNPLLLAAFNQVFYRFSATGGPAAEDFDAFFYPLDRILDWNLLYGPSGFFQYQCVIPDPGEEGIAACLSFLADNGLGAFLSVLKRCGDDEALLPFCRRGYTLALDIPNRGKETLRRLDRLDELVLRHGGRVYLTKDARLSREAFRAMYPERTAFMDTVRKYNPDGASKSRLAERLGLWEA